MEAIRLTERLVTLNDLAEPEVLLDVVVLEIERDNTFLLGPDNLPQSVSFSGLTGVGAAAPPATAILNQIGANGLGLKSFVINNRTGINFKQDLLNADLLANPRIRVSNREKERFTLAKKSLFLQPTSNRVLIRLLLQHRLLLMSELSWMLSHELV